MRESIVSIFVFVAMISFSFGSYELQGSTSFKQQPVCDGNVHSLAFQGSAESRIDEWLESNPGVVILGIEPPHWNMDPLRIKYRCK